MLWVRNKKTIVDYIHSSGGLDTLDSEKRAYLRNISVISIETYVLTA